MNLDGLEIVALKESDLETIGLRKLDEHARFRHVEEDIFGGSNNNNNGDRSSNGYKTTFLTRTATSDDLWQIRTNVQGDW